MKRDLVVFFQEIIYVKNKGWGRPQIKPPRIANCIKFPEIRSEDCDPLRVIRSKHVFAKY